MDYKTFSREEQNKILRRHGYYWEKITQDWLDDNDDFETRPGWHLYSKDHREISVSRAFREIEIGVEAVEKEVRAADDLQFAQECWDKEFAYARRQMTERIQKEGVRPTGDHSPEGDVILDTQNIYGGGDWFVIGTDAIWYCENNGMDGDNWSYNNVRTGGAGAIGWRMDYDKQVEFILRLLAKGELPNTLVTSIGDFIERPVAPARDN